MRIERPLYLSKLISRMGTDQVKIVTGVRRCGKSYLVFTLFKEYLVSHGTAASHIIEMAFDRYSNRRYQDPNVFMGYVEERLAAAPDGPRYILLDEVQLLGDFSAVLIDLIARENVDVFVTGSNARLLSKDIVTEFRGRGDEIEMRPLSFAEFMTTFDGNREAGWQSYLTYGGLPAVALRPNAQDRVDYLTNLFSEIYLTDIAEHSLVRNEQALGETLDVVASSIGSLTNPSRLANTFGSVTHARIRPETVSRYLELFCDSFLIEQAVRFDIRGNRYIGTPSKYYFIDLGLRNARLNFRQVEPTHLMENAIYNELRTRGYGVDVGAIETSERNQAGSYVRKQLEVDFVCNRGSERCYIQSAYSLPDEAKLDQEQRPLARIDDSFRKVIVVHDPVEPHYTPKGVLVLSLYDFLLDANSLHM